MLVLAVLGLLAAPVAADTSVRIPGTTLRFGLTDSTVSARGFAVTDTSTRKGHCRFFGLESEARLGIEDGRLASAEFAVTGASPYEIAYVADQLTAMGYRRRCETSTSRASVCDWTGRTQVRLAVEGAVLRAVVWPPGVDAAAFEAPRATAPSAGPSPPTWALARLTGTGATAETTAAAARRPVARPPAAPPPAAPPPVARPTAPSPPAASPPVLSPPARPPAPSPPAASPPVLSPPAPSPPAASSPVLSPPAAAQATPRFSAPVHAPRDSVRSPAPPSDAVPVLPETLAVKVAGRPSRYASATALNQPRCGYPEAARAAGIQGRVWVLVLVDTDGRVIRAHVTRSIAALDAAALHCVRDWSFKPVSWRGVPCRFWATVPVTFTTD